MEIDEKLTSKKFTAQAAEYLEQVLVLSQMNFNKCYYWQEILR